MGVGAVPTTSGESGESCPKSPGRVLASTQMGAAADQQEGECVRSVVRSAERMAPRALGRTQMIRFILSGRILSCTPADRRHVLRLPADAALR